MSVFQRCSKGMVLGTIFFLFFFPLFSLFGGSSWKSEFKKGFSSKNSWERAKAVRSLDPNEKSQFKYLLNLLKVNDWYIRKAAWETIANSTSEDTWKAVEKELKKTSRSRYRIREGLINAIAIKHDRTFVPILIQKLRDPAWPVVRASALALRVMPDKRSIGPLIQCWKKNQKNVRIWSHVRDTLEKITNRFMGNEVRNWENWWAVNEGSFTIGSKDEEAAKKAEKEGNKAKRVKTVLRGVELDFSTRGKGDPLFVIPDYGYNEKYLMPYLAPLEKVAKVFYIKLPPIRSFKGLQQQAGGVVYPVDKLVDAFDALREKYKQKRVAIMAHGVSAWIAMRFASKYPKRVSHLILVSAFSGQNAYRNGVMLLERTGKQTGDLEMEHFAQTLQIIPPGQPKYKPSSMEEQKAMMRKEWTLRFYDQGDALLGDLFKKSFRPDSMAIVPPFELSKEPKYNIPTLVINGKHALLTSAGDGKNIAKHYGSRSRFYLFPRSRRMPFIEENRTFVRLLKGFLRKY
ncbi:MAG: hypothetical protein D6785_07135 [Planctomycetota bacterium]|nr:MAG: hypothetical protein D6785_07135 [Planctomycetota bacterium]